MIYSGLTAANSGLTVVKVDQLYKVAQYGEGDHQPSVNGVYILEFLRTHDLTLFKEKVKSCMYVSIESIYKYYLEIKADDNYNYDDLDISNRFNEEYPLLGYILGSKILDIIYNSFTSLSLIDSIKFVKGSEDQSCRYVYIIDFDLNNFEVYEGFYSQPTVPLARWPFTKNFQRNPLTLIKEFSLSNLPDKEEFLTGVSQYWRRRHQF
jgi:hypothetical protein